MDGFDAPPTLGVDAARDLTNGFGGSSIRRIRQGSEPRGVNAPAGSCSVCVGALTRTCASPRSVAV